MTKKPTVTQNLATLRLVKIKSTMKNNNKKREIFFRYLALSVLDTFSSFFSYLRKWVLKNKIMFDARTSYVFKPYLYSDGALEMIIIF